MREPSSDTSRFARLPRDFSRKIQNPKSKIQNPKSKIDRHITHPLLKLGKLSKILQKLLDRGEP